MDKAYKVSAKRPDTGKWWTYGSIKKNKWDKVQLGMKVTDELVSLIEANKGKWVNFSLFEEDGAVRPPETQESQQPESDDIPF